MPEYLATKSSKSAAIEMGLWEIRIQSPDGEIGEPLGLFNEKCY